MEPKNVTISMWQCVQFFKNSYFDRLGTADLDIALCDITHIQKFNTNMQYTAPGQMAGEMIGVNCMNFLQN
jgi:hypothetical protein